MTKTVEKKPKRVKRVYTNSEIFHVWAHQKVDSGRNATGNVYFEGDTIYSYGSHFPMARLLRKKGKIVAVLTTTRSSSHTTNGHMADVRSAVSHLQRFTVYNVLKIRRAKRNEDGTDCKIWDEENHPSHIKEYREDIERLVGKVEAAKIGKRFELNSLVQRIKEFARYIKFFNLKTKVEQPSSYWFEKQNEFIKILATKEKELAEQKAARQREIDAVLIAEYPIKIQDWLNGEGDRPPVWSYQWGTPPHPHNLLRVKGSRIQTSKGAIVNIEDATKLLERVRLPQVNVVNELLPPLEISGYAVNSIDYKEGLVRIGCHTIQFSEIERIAQQLKL